MTNDQRNYFNKIAIAVLNGLKITAASTFFHKELSDLFESNNKKKLFNKCRILVHQFCKERNLEGYEDVRIQDSVGGAMDAYLDSLAFNRDKFLTEKEMLDYSYLGSLSNATFHKINEKKEESIDNGLAARTAIKCAKKIMENQYSSIPECDRIDSAINHLKIAKKQAKKGTVDLFAVVEALECISIHSDTSIVRAKELMEKCS